MSSVAPVINVEPPARHHSSFVGIPGASFQFGPHRRACRRTCRISLWIETTAPRYRPDSSTVDQRLVPAGVVQAIGDQVMHAKPTHIGEVHRRAGRVLGVHSMTSSARARSEGGTARPRAFAVLRFMTSSNLVGCSTGKSAGFSPLRMRPV